MAQAELTEQSVIEAGIAASIAANPNLIPTQSIYAQDFTFGGTMFDAAFGNAEALGGVGAAVADVAIEERMKLEEEERKENDPAKDASMIVEIAERQRQEAVRYANGQFLINGIAYSQDEVDQALDIAERRINERADRDGWSEGRRARALESVENARKAETPEEQAEAIEDMRQNPDAFDEFEQGLQDVRADNLQPEENADREVAVIDEGQDFTVQRAASMDDSALVDENLTARSGLSVGDNPFADTRASADSFNPAARGETAQPVLAENTTPAPISEQRFEV